MLMTTTTDKSVLLPVELLDLSDKYPLNLQKYFLIWLFIYLNNFNVSVMLLYCHKAVLFDLFNILLCIVFIFIFIRSCIVGHIGRHLC